MRITLILAICNLCWTKNDNPDNSILIEQKGALLDKGGELIIRLNIPYQSFILQNLDVLLTTVNHSLPNWYKEYNYEDWWSNTIYQPMNKKTINEPSISIKNKIYNLNPSIGHTYLTIRKNIAKTLSFMKTSISYLDSFNLIDNEHKRIIRKFEQLNTTIHEEDINSKYFREILDREKRGLLNIFGEGLKFVFGVATERDVQSH